jgi:hypothetical protein
LAYHYQHESEVNTEPDWPWLRPVRSVWVVAASGKLTKLSDLLQND